VDVVRSLQTQLGIAFENKVDDIEYDIQDLKWRPTMTVYLSREFDNILGKKFPIGCHDSLFVLWKLKHPRAENSSM